MDSPHSYGLKVPARLRSTSLTTRAALVVAAALAAGPGTAGEHESVVIKDLSQLHYVIKTPSGKKIVSFKQAHPEYVSTNIGTPVYAPGAGLYLPVQTGALRDEVARLKSDWNKDRTLTQSELNYHLISVLGKRVVGAEAGTGIELYKGHPREGRRIDSGIALSSDGDANGLSKLFNEVVDPDSPLGQTLEGLKEAIEEGGGDSGGGGGGDGGGGDGGGGGGSGSGGD